MMKKILPFLFVLLFTIFLIVGLGIGEIIGTGQETVYIEQTLQPNSQPVIQSSLQPTNTPLPFTIANERILFLGVDRIEAEEALILSIWIVSRGDTPSSFVAAPIYPAPGYLSGSLNQTRINPKDFIAIKNLDILQEEKNSLTGIVVLDQAGFATLLSIAQGKNNYEQCLAQIMRIPSSIDDPESAFEQQRSYLQVIYREIQESNQSPPIDTIYQNLLDMQNSHIYTNISPTQLFQISQNLDKELLDIRFVDNVDLLP